jgi:hypothetical protein
VRAAELNHEPADDTVEVKPIIEAALGELDEVARGLGHDVREELDFNVAERGFEACGRVGHAHGVSAFLADASRNAKRDGARPAN